MSSICVYDTWNNLSYKLSMRLKVVSWTMTGKNTINRLVNMLIPHSLISSLADSSQLLTLIPPLLYFIFNPPPPSLSLSLSLSLPLSLSRIIAQLENLKKEAAEIQKKVEETDVVMAEVESVSQQYLPLSTSSSSLYFTLDTLNQVYS